MPALVGAVIDPALPRTLECRGAVERGFAGIIVRSRSVAAMKKATARRQRATSQVGRHRCHGDPQRFAVLADFVADRFSHHRYVADVAGGQGLLTRALNKRHNFEAEVIDPRGWVVKGVPHRQEDFDASMSSYYDLIVGLHPDEAIAEVVTAARERPTILVPCCNFWNRERRLSRDQLLEAIIDHHVALSGTYEHVELSFKGPHNHALILEPPAATDARRSGAIDESLSCQPPLSDSNRHL